MEKVITAIKVQQHNPQRVSIDLDGEFAFGLSRLTAAWLKTGDPLNEEKISSLLRQDALEVAYQQALRLLSHRLRSEKEIRGRLGDKGYTVEQIDLVIEKLQSENMIRDERFAKSWVESRNEFHPRSHRLLKRELSTKGVEDTIIEAALGQSETDEQLARQAGEQYSRRLAGLDKPTFTRRLSGFLARRGFSYSTIHQVVQEIWQDESAFSDNILKLDKDK